MKNIKNKKSFFVVPFLIITLIVVSLSAVSCTAQTVETRIQIEKVEVLDLYAGKQGTVIISIKNIGHESLLSTIATLTPAVEEGLAGLTIYPVVPAGSSQIHVGILPPGVVTQLEFSVAANPGTAPGTYMMDLSIYYELASGLSRTSTQKIGVSVLTNPFGAYLEIMAVEVPELYQGEVEGLTVSLRNIGEATLINTEVILKPEVDEDTMIWESVSYPVVPVGSSHLRVGELSAGESVSLEFSVAANPGTAPGTYMMDLSIYYELASGESRSSTQKLGVTVISDPFDDYLEIMAVEVPELYQGEVEGLTVSLRNIGEETLTNAAVVINPAVSTNTRLGESVSYPVVPVGSSHLRVGELHPGAYVSWEFLVVANPGTTPGTYMMDLSIYYELSSGRSREFTQKMGVMVLPELQPILTIDNIRTVPKKLLPGQNFTLTFDILNSGSSVENLLITVGQVQSTEERGGLLGLLDTLSSEASSQSSSSPIIPIGSNFRLLDNIDVGMKKEVNFTLAVPNELEIGTYPVVVAFGYLDQESNPTSLAQTIGIQVFGEAKLSLFPISTEQIGMGKFQNKMKIMNIGLQTAKDVRFSVIENDFFKPDKSAYVAGVLGPDDSVEAEVTFTSKTREEGIYPSVFCVTYIDNGVYYEEYFTEDVNVGQTIPGASSLGVFGLVLAGLVGVPVLTFYAIRLRRRLRTAGETNSRL